MDAPGNWSKSRDGLRAELSKRGLDDVAEVWVCKLHAQGEKAAVMAWPRAAIHWYEAGLETYLEHEVLCGGHRFSSLSPQNWPGALKREWRHSSDGDSECAGLVGWCRRDLRRLEGLHLLLGHLLPKPGDFEWLPVQDVAATDVLSVLNDLSDTEGSRYPEGAAWVIGQNFSGGKEWTPTEELARYADICAELIGKGYPVVWVDHPRALEPLGPKLMARCRADHLMIADLQGYPLEMVLGRSKAALVVSVSSTALYYAQNLFAIDSYTLQHRIEHWKHPDLARIAALAGDCLSPVEEIPDRKGSVA